jgi:hypothetical protein
LGLRKSDADPSGGPPHDPAFAEKTVGLDDKGEFVGNAERAGYFQAGPFIRDIAYDAIDSGGAIERDRSGLQGAGSWSGALFGHNRNHRLVQSVLHVEIPSIDCVSIYASTGKQILILSQTRTHGAALVIGGITVADKLDMVGGGPIRQLRAKFRAFAQRQVRSSTRSQLR